MGSNFIDEINLLPEFTSVRNKIYTQAALVKSLNALPVLELECCVDIT